MICCKRKIKGHLYQGIEVWDFRMKEGGENKIKCPSLPLWTVNLFSRFSLWWQNGVEQRLLGFVLFSNFWHRMSKSRKTSWGYCMATKTGGFDWAWEKERTKATSVSKCCCFSNPLRKRILAKQKHHKEISACNVASLMHPYNTGQRPLRC